MQLSNNKQHFTFFYPVTSYFSLFTMMVYSVLLRCWREDFASKMHDISYEGAEMDIFGSLKSRRDQHGQVSDFVARLCRRFL